MNTPEQLDASPPGRLDGGFCYRFGALPDGFASIGFSNSASCLRCPSIVRSSREQESRRATCPRGSSSAFHGMSTRPITTACISACAERGLTLEYRPGSVHRNGHPFPRAGGRGRGARQCRQSRPSARARALHRLGRLAGCAYRSNSAFHKRRQHEANLRLNASSDLLKQRAAQAVMP